MTIALAPALRVVIGVLLGLLGGGGSILAVPALVYALGLGVELAIPISLIVIGVASAAGAVPKVRAGQVQWRLAAIVAAVGIPATLAGYAIGRHLSQPAIMLGFAVVMVIAGGRMLSDFSAAAFPEINTAVAHLRDVLGDTTYESLARKGETMTTAAMATDAYDQIDQARTELNAVS